MIRLMSSDIKSKRSNGNQGKKNQFQAAKTATQESGYKETGFVTTAVSGIDDVNWSRYRLVCALVHLAGHAGSQRI